ncbi:MAG: SMC-Scp complex subunit ScpB [Erysipelotrichaceae bacterium]|jgi:segregation and condensation protein B|nr:SMC-Scp complex subunit ScpB [Lactimicrobium massiliense]MCH4019829.1 SMC-Scp complex subunit ScpB [Erysipelotrichaceae bacterium]MCI1326592.1 SMC-Scp complex subunit ScpB [Solobacterium sp.]MCH4045177.1 SMC-Scp complex subunit ScpB [Erysipelotrichaceae bacterium]MCH4122388.1 SMC-Scp complex subunit ScpB [Erysipelotrichaceae bacterium]MCI1362979.1 SMC-Scp complex subunit ScpB [Solobacterium sp.]
MSEQLAEQQNETDLQAAAELNQRQLAVLEGLLFVTGDEGLTAAQAADTLGVSEKQAEELFAQLQKAWQSDDRGLEVVRYGDIYRFLTKAFVHSYAARLFSKDVKTQLSQAALETLAIIAYKQPVTRVEIEEIRGVSADAMLRKLIARGLVKEDGRSEAPGRPILYSVTNEFMDAFQLLSLDELPDLPAFNQDEKKNDDLFTQ